MFSPAQESDSVLVDRMATGDDRALAELYDRHGRAAYSLAMAIVGDPADAEEVVADAFLRLWRAPERFDRARGTVAAYLLTMTRSGALDRVRARRRRVDAEERASARDERGVAAPLSSPGDPPDRTVERQESREVVTRALASLPDAQRRAIELAYFGGLTHSEIARELDEPLGTVKTRIRSGMQKLREALFPSPAEAEP